VASSAVAQPRPVRGGRRRRRERASRRLGRRGRTRPWLVPLPIEPPARERTDAHSGEARFQNETCTRAQRVADSERERELPQPAIWPVAAVEQRDRPPTSPSMLISYLPATSWSLRVRGSVRTGSGASVDASYEHPLRQVVGVRSDLVLEEPTGRCPRTSSRSWPARPSSDRRGPRRLRVLAAASGSHRRYAVARPACVAACPAAWRTGTDSRGTDPARSGSGAAPRP